jgi:Fic family protein
MLYIHQYPDWTHFRFDSRKVLNALGETRLQEGKLIGAMETCGFQDLEQELLIQDIRSNSAIDGIHLDKAFVEQQVALVQGGSAQSADPAVRIYLAAITKAFNPLTQERLFAWHASMGQNKVASFRAAPSAVQYRQGELQLDFEGPNPERLEQEVERYIQWMESSSMDGVIKAAVAHFWFATLRPFADANGRLARLLTIVALARSEQTTRCQFSLNQAFLERREDYFKILNATQRGNGDLTEWILWFIETLQAAMSSTRERILKEQRKTAFYNRHAGEAFDEKDQKLFTALFAGTLPASFTAKELAAIIDQSHDTALRTIQKLIAKGILKSDEKGGRSQRYSIRG